MSVYYVNINGYLSKSDSLHHIIKSLDPDIIILCEIRSVTANTIRTQFKALGYEPFIGKASGMIVAAKFKFDMVNVTSTMSSRIISTSIKVGNTHMTLTGVYGPQESEKEEIRSQFYEELETEIVAGLNRGNHILVIGDFNSKIAMKNGKYEELSPNGTLLNGVIDRSALHVLNFLDVCSGKWTRVHTSTVHNQSACEGQ